LNYIDQQRDSILKDVDNSSEKNVNESRVITELKKLKSFFDGFFKKQKVPPTINLSKQVVETQTQVEQLQNALPVIQKVLVYILIAVLIYYFGSFLGFLSQVLVFSVLVYGVYDIYFSHIKTNE
jgi:hypothetical protein